MASEKAGRELDALVAEKVMGISLVVPRERAVALIGASYTSETGPAFTLRTGDVVGIPDNLPVLPGDASSNERYFRYVGEWLLNDSEDKAVRVKASQELADLRASPKAYSTDISAAWEVVERIKTPATYVEVLAHKGEPHWICRVYADRTWDDGTSRPLAGAGADTAPLAICLAALKVVEALPPSPRLLGDQE